jgi:hypothetical protein
LYGVSILGKERGTPFKLVPSKLSFFGLGHTIYAKHTNTSSNTIIKELDKRKIPKAKTEGEI